MSSEAGLLQDTAFWVLLASLAFAVVFKWKGWAPLSSALDARTTRIKNELEEAARLKQEAQNLLNAAQKQQRDALQTAQKIIDEAKATAKTLNENTLSKLSEDMARREAQLISRIARAEEQALEDLRDRATAMAVQAAEKVLKDMMPEQNDRLVNEAIGTLPSIRLHG